MKDYYYILGINKAASKKEIRTAYYKLSKKFHPDKNDGDAFFTARFQEIQDAWETLGDPTKRKQYDEQLINHRGKWESKPPPEEKAQNATSPPEKKDANDESGVKSFNIYKWAFLSFICIVLLTLWYVQPTGNDHPTEAPTTFPLPTEKTPTGRYTLLDDFDVQLKIWEEHPNYVGLVSPADYDPALHSTINPKKIIDQNTGQEIISLTKVEEKNLPVEDYLPILCCATKILILGDDQKHIYAVAKDVLWSINKATLGVKSITSAYGASEVIDGPYQNHFITSQTWLVPRPDGQYGPREECYRLVDRNGRVLFQSTDLDKVRAEVEGQALKSKGINWVKDYHTAAINPNFLDGLEYRFATEVHYFGAKRGRPEVQTDLIDYYQKFEPRTFSLDERSVVVSHVWEDVLVEYRFNYTVVRKADQKLLSFELNGRMFFDASGRVKLVNSEVL